MNTILSEYSRYSITRYYKIIGISQDNFIELWPIATELVIWADLLANILLCETGPCSIMLTS